jgi:ankyrin repeat protein
MSVIELCLEYDASLHAMNALGKTALHFAAAGAQSQAVNFLLQRGADPNSRTLDSPGHPEGNMTPLMFAATSRAGDEKCISTIQALLGASNNINERGPGGATALWLACNNGRKQIVQALLHSGADLCICDHRGVMPSQAARESGTKRCATYLKVSPKTARMQDSYSIHVIEVQLTRSHMPS